MQSVSAPPAEAVSALPEGFFDDPERDARVRKVEYVDKMEVEWDAFTREMKQESNVGTSPFDLSISTLDCSLDLRQISSER